MSGGLRKLLALAALLLCLLAASVGAVPACSAASAALRAADGGGRRFQGRVSVGEDCSLVVDGVRWSEDVVATYVPDDAAQQGSSAAGRLEFEQTYGQDGSATLRVALPPALPVRRVEVRDAATAGLLAAAALQQQQQPGGTVVLTLAAAHLEATAAGSSAARSLQAAGCSLTVDGQAHAFDHCETITYTGSSTFTYYYTLDTSGAAPVLQAGVKAAPLITPASASAGGWVAFGVATHPGEMQGAQVAIVRSAPSLATTSMAGYVLPSSDATDADNNVLYAAMGTVAITANASSVQPDGTISAVFTLPVDKTAAQLAASPQLDFLWATGPLKPDGNLDEHRGESKGGGVLMFAAESQSPPASPSPAAAGCSLTVDGQAHAFDHCETKAYAGTTFAYYYSLDTSGAAPVLQAGVKAAPLITPASASAGGWVAFGVATHPGEMQGAQVAIVRSAPSLATTSMAGYVLPSSDATDADNNVLYAAMGTVAITANASSVQPDGTISAVFTLPVDKTAAQLAASPQLDFLWATGPLKPDGNLDEHRGESKGGGVLTFTGSQSSPSPSPPESQGGSSGSSVTTAQNCALSIGNGEQKFTNCFLQSSSNDFHVMWSLSNDINVAQATLTMGINGTTTGYIAIGFPTQSGQMTDSTSLILQTCSSCPSGASLTPYWMSGTSESNVNPGAGQNPSQVPATNLQAATTSSGQLVGSFEVKVSDLPLAARRRLLQVATVNLPLIFAVGNLNSAGSPAEHFYKSAATVDLTGGAVAASGMSSLEKAHAWTSTIGWGVLIPSAIVMARSYKDVGPKSMALWFKVHRAVAASGFVLGTVGFGLGLAIGGGNSEYSVHRNLGIAVTVLGATQVTALVVRPAPGTKYRVGWEYWHHWVGRSAAVLAIANIYYGIIEVEKLSTWAWATYTGILVAIVAASVVKDGVSFAKKRRQAKASAGKPADSALELSAIQSMA